jgi:hypothetical protein
MATDFPNSPTNGQTFTGSNGVAFQWDGVKWASESMGASFLLLAGGTMTGPIVLSGNATAPLNPVTLQQLTNTTTGYLPLAGGTLAGPGNLTVNGLLNVGTAAPWRASVTAKGNVMLGVAEPASMATADAVEGGWLQGWGVTADNHAFNAYYNGTSWVRLNARAPFVLDVAGTTMAVLGAATGAANTTFSPTTLATVDTTGNVWAGGNLTTVGSAIIGANALVGGAVYPTNGATSNGFYLNADATYRYINWAPNWTDYWRVSDGARIWSFNGSQWLTVDGSSNFWCHGNIATDNALTAAWIHSTGNAQIDGTLNANGNLTCGGTVQGGYVHSTGTVQADANVQTNGAIYLNDVIYFRGGNCGISPNNWAYRLNRQSSDGTWTFVENNTVNAQVQTNGNIYARNECIGSNGVQANGNNGIWFGQTSHRFMASLDGNGTTYLYMDGRNFCYIVANTSDGRIKDVIGPNQRGLAEILGLRVVDYRFKGNDNPPDQQDPLVRPFERDSRTVHTGIIGQEAESVFPELVDTYEGYLDGERANDMRRVRTERLTWAFVNAIQELSRRLDALETLP